MKEKERYDLIEDDLAYAIVGKETHKTFENDSIVFCNICGVLNQQDRQIKELSQEKEQLKEQLNNSEQTCLICNKDKENEQLNQRIKELEEELKKYKSYKTDDERIKDLTHLYEKYSTENQQLKQQLKNEKNTSAELVSLIDTMRYEDPKINELEQQLHDLPKKIVEEIKETNIYLNSSKPNQKNHIYDSYLIDAEKLDTILKKYEVENDKTRTRKSH